MKLFQSFIDLKNCLCDLKYQHAPREIFAFNLSLLYALI